MNINFMILKQLPELSNNIWAKNIKGIKLNCWENEKSV